MREATIGTRLGLGLSAVLALAVLSGLTAIGVNVSLARELRQTVEQTARKQMLAGQILAISAEMEALDRGVATSSMLQQKQRATEFERTYRDAEQRVASVIQEFARLNNTDKTRGRVLAVAAVQKDLISSQDQFIHMLAGDQMDQALAKFDSDVLPQLGRMGEMARALVSDQESELQARSDSADRTQTRSLWIVILAALACAASCLAMFGVVRKITARLRTMTSDLARCATGVSAAAVQISAASVELADGSSRQAASLEETSASSQELSSMTKVNSTSAQEATVLMQDADNQVTEANRTLEQMVQSMGAIRAAAEKIAKIIKIIDEIAFQTNILALNAAVEAARAGDAGMGFAVVADEVRSLAGRCAQAARDTAELIAESIHSTHEGTARLDHVTTAITAMTDSSAKAKRLVDQVCSSSGEQARGITQIADALSEVDRLTQRASAHAQESAATSESMREQAQAMSNVTRELVEMVG
jgi:methyl-accepting chemotaxis protein/methyl-accepting chemotaxis protein-1 (serine sensor receptor)